MQHIDVTPFIREVEAHAARMGLSPATYCNRTIGHTYALPRLISAANRINERVTALREAMKADRLGSPDLSIPENADDLGPTRVDRPPAPGRLTFVLPTPTSVNHLYRPGPTPGSRKRTDAANRWLATAKQEIMAQRGAMPKKALRPGPYAVRIRLSLDDPGDVDNRAKLILDVLHHMKVTPDDSWCYNLSIGRSASVNPGFAVVTVRSITAR